MMLDKFSRRFGAFRQFLQQASLVSRETRQGLGALLADYLQLKRATGLSAREYFLYELYRGDLPRSEKLRYLTRALHERYLAPLDPPQYDALIADKFVFKQYFGSLGIPVARTLGLYHPFHGRTSEGAPLRTSDELKQLLARCAAAGIVVKPARGGCGVGVLVFSESATTTPIALKHVSGESYALERLSSMLKIDEPHKHPGYLLEERVVQHPFLSNLNPATLHTTRVVTLRADDGTLHVVGATLKIGLDDSGVESLIETNLCAPIDLDTGRLGLAVFHDGRKYSRIERHPRHDQPITGEALPCWPDVRRLALQAADAARCVRSIGWDIGLTPAGPVLIEGNQIWGEEILQIAQGRGIWTPEFRALLGLPIAT